uniref:Uncharacterized protein n=1 Tax=Nothobranchius furzeri TaxID=105023 RepID=A0A1A8A9S1_NOTFU
MCLRWCVWLMMLDPLRNQQHHLNSNYNSSDHDYYCVSLCSPAVPLSTTHPAPSATPPGKLGSFSRKKHSSPPCTHFLTGM